MSQTSSGKKGSISPTVIYTNKDALQGNPAFVTGVPPIIECCLPPKPGNWVVTFVGEQYLWTPEGAHVSRADGGREEDFDVATQFFGQNQPGVGLYYRFAYTPEDRNYWNMSISGGIGARGVINGRPLDRMGVGLYWMKSSGDLNDEPIVNGILQNETGVEAYYNFAITPWLQISADLQYVNAGLAGTDNSWVLGTRLFMQF
jgi:hypothetical protein